MKDTSSLTNSGDASDWFCDLMKDLAAAYPHFKASERQTRVYAAALQDLTERQVRGAMGRAIIESRYFPSVAELRGFIEPSLEDKAQRAWLALRDAVSSVGSWRSLVIHDVCAAEALRRVVQSWPEFCNADDGPSLMVMRQGFLSSYRDARRTVPPSAPAVRLPGLCEASGAAFLENATTVATLTLDGELVVDGVTRALPAAKAPLQLEAGKEQ